MAGTGPLNSENIAGLLESLDDALDDEAPYACITSREPWSSAPRHAVLLPLANTAMLDRFRVGVRRRGRVRLEALPDRAGVRCVFRHPEARRVLAAGPAERQMHQLGFDPLRQRQQVRVQEKLQQRLALRASRQLRVENFVGPPAQHARP